jgi:DNA polymerase III subunit alpha
MATMYGVIEFYQACKKEGIKPIIGVELYLAPDLRKKESTSRIALTAIYCLLAKNRVGYKNLIKLVTVAHLEGFYYKPRIDWETLSSSTAEGLDCLHGLFGW